MRLTSARSTGTADSVGSRNEYGKLGLDILGIVFSKRKIDPFLS